MTERKECVRVHQLQVIADGIVARVRNILVCNDMHEQEDRQY